MMQFNVVLDEASFNYEIDIGLAGGQLYVLFLDFNEKLHGNLL